jgi:2',3'-cyclic-nucleotide 2'-phosphodiesterase (5'-nucleotidase family)
MLVRKYFFPLFLSATFFVVACHHQAQVTKLDVGYVEMNKTELQYDSATDKILQPYKDSLDKLMNVVIGRTAVPMPKERDKPETLLGNFVADICYNRLERGDASSVMSPGKYGPIDICLFNTGGLRASLPEGNITRGNIFELMPFDNELVVVTLSGKKTWELIRYVAMTGGQPMSGMKLGIHPDKTPATVFIGGAPFDSTKTYRIVTSDYLANGGDKMDFFKNPIKNQTTGILIRNAILDYCIAENAKGNALTAKLDGRFYYETK